MNMTQRITELLNKYERNDPWNHQFTGKQTYLDEYHAAV